MGILTKAFSTYSISNFVVKKAKYVLTDTEFGQAIVDKAKDLADKAVAEYASHIESDKWDNVVSKYSADELTEEEKAERAELAEAFSDAVAGDNPEKWSELTESINNNPEVWGEYLTNKNVTPEKIEEMTKDGASGYDLAKLSFGISVSNVKEEEAEQEAEHSDAEPSANETESAEPEPEQQAQGQTESQSINEKRGAEAAALYDSEETEDFGLEMS